MERHLFLAIALIGFLNTPAGATTPDRCESNAANCVGRCANRSGGTNDNRCMNACDRRVTSCLVRAHGATWR
jgi:hypothetical protein